MRILLVGEGKPSGRLVAYRRAFIGVGHDVAVVDTDRLYRPSLANRLFNRLWRLPHYLGTKCLNDGVLRSAERERPDLILFIKPIYVKRVTVEALHRSGTLCFSWYPDNIFYRRNASRAFYDAMPLYDCHFSTKSFNVPALEMKGARRAVFLPHAVDASYHHPVTPTAAEKGRLGADVVFIGNWARDRRVQYLERLCREGYQVKVYGNGWKRVASRSALVRRGALQHRAVYGREMALALCSSKIAAAFLRREHSDVQTARTYEIPACGVFMLHERTPEVAEIYREGEQAEFFDSYDEFRVKVDRYLRQPALREHIAQAGYHRATHPDLSYAARVEIILRVYSELRSTCAG